MFGIYKRITTVVFDLDGTILHTWPSQFEWFKKACELHNKPFPYKTPAELREVYKEPVVPDFYESLGFNWEQDKGQLWKEYTEHRSGIPPILVPGIEEVLRSLHKNNFRLAIASNSNRLEIETHLTRLGVRDLFSAIQGPEEGMKPKPSPDILLKVLEDLKCKPNRAAYVDDTPAGVQAANEVGMFSVGVFLHDAAYSTSASIQEAKPDIFVEETSYLEKIFVPRR